MEIRKLITVLLFLGLLSACSTRDIQDELNGSTAQRLITHSIDDMIRKMDDEALASVKDQKVYINSYFLNDSKFREYADQRLAVELSQRFGAEIVKSQAESDQVMTVFYTSLATDFDNFGISIPFGYVPGVDESSKLSIITLEKYHGIAEMYFYIGPTGTEHRSKVIQAVVKTDALGLPIITIPLSNIDRHESLF